MIRIRNREMARTPGAGRKRCGFQNDVLFFVLAAGAAVLASITSTGYVTVLASDNIEQSQEMTGDDSLRLTGVGTFGDADNVNIHDSQTDDAGQVYDFKDNKTTGTVTVTKVWDDGLTNDEREIPDIKISTKKPSKSTLGYTVTFHGNGLKFADGSETNEIVLNSSGQIVSGMFKVPGNTGAAAAISWYSDESCKNRIEVSDDGIPQIALAGDLDLWAKEKTFEIKGYTGNYKKRYNDFNYLIPDTVTSIIFTDVILSGIALLNSVPVFVTNVTAFAYRLISPSSCKSGIPVLDTLTLLMHSGSVYQKAYASPGTLYCPSMIFILLLNSISFLVLPSANVIPFP